MCVIYSIYKYTGNTHTHTICIYIYTHTHIYIYIFIDVFCVFFLCNACVGGDLSSIFIDEQVRHHSGVSHRSGQAQTLREKCRKAR